MKKVIFGVFAHPDDEAFGPSGTLLMEKAAGSEIHLICATAGESGVNPDQVEDLAATRLQEWKTAGSLIGADSMHQLGYRDGHLCNNNYHEVAEKIKTIITQTIDGRDAITVEFMSMDLNGISGHLDHIFISRVASYVFCNFRDIDPRFTRMRLVCIPHEQASTSNCSWLYMEAGRRADEISETIDAREHVEKVYEIMRAHHSQRADGESHIQRLGEGVAINYFIDLP